MLSIYRYIYSFFQGGFSKSIGRFTAIVFLSISYVYATTVAVPIDENVDLNTDNNHPFTTQYATQSLSQQTLKSVAVTSASVSSNISAAGIPQSSAGQYVSQPVLLLRLSFTDRDFKYSRSDFERLIFSKDPSVSSVAQYYLENSYQQFHISPAQEIQGVANDGIIDVRLPYEHPNFGENYGSRSQSLVRDALKEIQGLIDLSLFDRNGDSLIEPNELAVVVMVAGYENAYGGSAAPEPRIWAHKSDISGASLNGFNVASFAMFGEQHQNHLATIGIISHEMGHLLFALPDLYDRQGDSNGIGRWGLMGLGSWNSRGGYSGSSPAHMMAWSKVKAGFIKPMDVMGSELEFALKSATNVPDAMRVWLDPFRHGEHFLLEYRKQSKLDRGLPGEGLLISHIDDWVGYGHAGPQNDVAEHKLVDIEEADGRNDLDQLENRGDRLDVYNDAYGQDYFGASSLPASLDYHGNSSGVEISNIRVGSTARGAITLPYNKLGDNLGHDTNVGVPWGVSGKETKSLIELSLSKDLSWAHGMDVFSPGVGQLTISLFTYFVDGELSGEIHSTEMRNVSSGWNRISFSERVDLSGFEKVFVRVSVRSDTSRPFSIDNLGGASGLSYVESNGVYRKVSFDFNQRLLVANQQQAFNYQVPKSVAYGSKEKDKSSGGGSAVFLFLLCLLGLRKAR